MMTNQKSVWIRNWTRRQSCSGPRMQNDIMSVTLWLVLVPYMQHESCQCDSDCIEMIPSTSRPAYKISSTAHGPTPDLGPPTSTLRTSGTQKGTSIGGRSSRAFCSFLPCLLSCLVEEITYFYNLTIYVCPREGILLFNILHSYRSLPLRSHPRVLPDP